MSTSALEGRWQPFYAELEGEIAPTEVLQQTEVVFGPSTYCMRFGGVVADSGVLLVETDVDHHFTLRATVGPNAGRTIPCLFKFDADTLTICYGLGGERPRNFRTAPGTQLYLVAYRRT